MKVTTTLPQYIENVLWMRVILVYTIGLGMGFIIGLRAPFLLILGLAILITYGMHHLIRSFTNGMITLLAEQTVEVYNEEMSSRLDKMLTKLAIGKHEELKQMIVETQGDLSPRS